LNLNFELVENKERLAAFFCDKINILYDVTNKIIAGLILVHCTASASTKN